jgi:hypothetical protein
MQKLGLTLIIVSVLPGITALILPFLPIPVTQKAFLIPGLMILADAIFWLGILLVGKEVAQKHRRFFHRRYLRMKLKKLWRR